VPVRWIDQVLELALESHPIPLTDEEVLPATVVAAIAPAVQLDDSVKH
jgi:ATP-dependent Lon protease